MSLSKGASASQIGLSQAEPVSRLGPAGFDPSRIKKLAAQCEVAPARRQHAIIGEIVELYGLGGWDVSDAFWFARASGAHFEAALILLEQAFPGAEAAVHTNWPLAERVPQNANADGSWRITDLTPRGCWVRFYGGTQMGALKNASGHALTPALAICAALLRALAASGMEARQGGNEVPCEARQLDGEAGTP